MKKLQHIHLSKHPTSMRYSQNFFFFSANRYSQNLKQLLFVKSLYGWAAEYVPTLYSKIKMLTFIQLVHTGAPMGIPLRVAAKTKKHDLVRFRYKTLLFIIKKNAYQKLIISMDLNVEFVLTRKISTRICQEACFYTFRLRCMSCKISSIVV